MTIRSIPVGPELHTLIQTAARDPLFQRSCQNYVHGNGTSEAIMTSAVAALDAVWRDPSPQRKRLGAIRALLTWLRDGGDADDLMTIDLEMLTDEDIERLFTLDRVVIRLPVLGKVT
jgi:hypothetical protein